LERGILLVVDLDTRKDGWKAEDDCGELRELAASSGVVCVGEVTCHRDKPTAGYFIGKGKAEEIASLCRQKNADVVIFNDDLSSAQQRNLEDIIQTKVIDRTQLVLDIFAQRAKSLEGKVQVELAQLEYMLPRLTGKGILLSRLGGGIGTRGPGEQKLEVDRRRIRRRISRLSGELDLLHRRRKTLRENRKSHALPTIAIIGYTNAGKSTLLNTITHSDVAVQDKVFTTLDPTTRRFILPNGQRVLFTDTVGFLHNLPHHLIEAFKATLEEVVEATLLLHVLDISDRCVHQHSDAVNEVLRQLGASDRPIITALNKVDLVEDERLIDNLLRELGSNIAICAKSGLGLGKLFEVVTENLSSLVTVVRFLVSPSQMNIVSRVYEEGTVLAKEYKNGNIFIEAQIPVALAERILPHVKVIGGGERQGQE
jgi:GTP-binding protein HflX